MWHFNGVKLSQSTEKQQILANGTLVIRQATLSDAGHYKCTATATAGQIEAEANVRVIGTYIYVDTLLTTFRGRRALKYMVWRAPRNSEPVGCRQDSRRSLSNEWTDELFGFID